MPMGCFFQGCYNPEYEAEIRKGKDLCWRFNALHPCDREGQMAVLKELLGEMGRDVVFTPPFWCDYGYNIKVGGQLLCQSQPRHHGRGGGAVR